MKGRHLAIVNPAAGRGAAAAKWERAAVGLSGLGETIWTEGRGHATEIARTANAERIYVAGGDGTVSEVVTALAGTSTEVVIAPFGTGNDLARSLNIPREPETWGKAHSAFAAQWIDAYAWECGGRRGYGVNIAGCGFDAIVAERINTGYRRLKGTNAYVAAVLQTLVTYQPAGVRVRVDGETLETTAMLVAVANSHSYGGGMRIAPQANLSDGVLEVVIVQGVSRSEFLRTFPKVFSGKHLSHPRVLTLRGRKVDVISSPLLPVLVDGEVVGPAPAVFEVLPGSVRVLAPSGS